jgi:hypothetical protein
LEFPLTKKLHFITISHIDIFCIFLLENETVSTILSLSAEHNLKP